MSVDQNVVGIDLGTTNSEVAAFSEGKVRVLGTETARMLPSCVGLSPEGELLVGEPARNQGLLYPELTVRSIKRKMGADVAVKLGDKSFSPQEISAIILRELSDRARRELGRPIEKAVITVPAYFSDAQRQATREAGALAGLEVVRILNEPTAASLAYGFTEGERQTLMVYDLGGGTFDVSIVTIEGEVTEVLASHGNNHLGGDDFDELLFALLADAFQDEHDVDLRSGHPAACARLWYAAEEAKKRLSFEPYTTVREEALVTVDGSPLHLTFEIARTDYEDLIRALVESTLDSVSKALEDAGKRARDLDGVLLVGGATRTPLVVDIIEERAGLPAKQNVDPDLCVALGAGVLASRLAGHDVERVLVDVSPYSFGISYLGERGGFPYPHCYKPIICRNTPLPITRTEAYSTSMPFQTTVAIDVYQGDDPDALKNVPVGDFMVHELTPTEEPNTVLCRMNLDLDGILHVTAIEKRTDKSKHISIDNALQPKSEEEVAAARERLDALFAGRWHGDEEDFDAEMAEDIQEAEPTSTPQEEKGQAPELAAAIQEARQLVERSSGLLESMHDEDKEEAIGLHENIHDAIGPEDAEALRDAVAHLKELLFFVEGK